MTEEFLFTGLNNTSDFTRKELLVSFRKGGYPLSEASFCKKIERMVGCGEIVRIGRNRYSLADENRRIYSHEYSEPAVKIAGLMEEKFPYLDFSVFECVQLNDFVNHMMGHNIIFLYVEPDAMDFVFEFLKQKYPGKVLINPTVTVYHQYWTDNMIVIRRLITESPKGLEKKWHARLEKMLVDIMSDPILMSVISGSEIPGIYTTAFEKYYVDETGLFRYAGRRKSAGRIKKMIQEETEITLKEKE